MESRLEVGCQHIGPGCDRKGSQQTIGMLAGVVYQHINTLVVGQNLSDRLLPRCRLSDIELESPAATREFRHQFVSVLASSVNPQPNEIVWRFVQEGARNGLAQTAVGARD